jgi:hypothetical protein
LEQKLKRVYDVSDKDGSSTVCSFTTKMVISVQGTASEGGSMCRMKVSFLQMESGRRVPPSYNVKFREARAESTDIPLNDMHTVQSMPSGPPHGTTWGYMTYGPGSIPGLAYKDCNINNLCYTTEK